MFAALSLLDETITIVDLTRDPYPTYKRPEARSARIARELRGQQPHGQWYNRCGPAGSWEPGHAAVGADLSPSIVT